MIFDPLVLTYALLGCIVILIGWIIRLEIKIKKLLVGKNSRSLEDSIVSAGENLEKLNAFQKIVIEHLETVDRRLGHSIQAVETVRFNPFKGIGEGGSQSFSTAFVSGNGDGAVISSLYSRDRMSVFSKPLRKFGSEFELTQEEKDVIMEAKKNIE